MLSNVSLSLSLHSGLTRSIAICTRGLGSTLRYETINWNRRLSHSESKLTPALAPKWDGWLSDEQQHALRLATGGFNVATIGAGGTGKTFLLKKIIGHLKARGRSVAVTTSTSLAAFNIGGTTLHACANAHSVKKVLETPGTTRIKSDYARKWCQTEVIVIDNISMIEAPYLSALDSITRQVQKDQNPFGGIQIVVAGDFFQLGPEPLNDVIPPFPFEVPYWNRTFALNQIELTQSFRQLQPKLTDLLNDARLGTISEPSADLLRSLNRRINSEDGITPVELFPSRVHTDRVNSRRIAGLKGAWMVFEAQDEIKYSSGKIVEHHAQAEEARVLLDEIAPRRIELKVGAQVMCTRDVVPGKITNSSLGLVTDFMTTEEASNAMRSVRMPYHPRFGNTEHLMKWPVVQFENGQEVLVPSVDFKLRDTTGDGVIMSRYQVPLVPAWAMEVDKTQTRSLSRMKIDLAGKFAPGLAYTALCRARSLEGLQVLNYSPGTINANEKVVTWYENWKNQWACSKPYLITDKTSTKRKASTRRRNF